MSKILIVEDEPSIAEGLVDLCQFKGYEAVHTDNGEDGYQQAITGNFDLIILDIMLPGMDGFTVCDKVREQDREIPIIILSAKNSDEDIVQGLRLGADDYINKPFSVSQLFARIEAVLRRSVKLSTKRFLLPVKKLRF
jgi:DNA-binding response OmpR family regulator